MEPQPAKWIGYMFGQSTDVVKAVARVTDRLGCSFALLVISALLGCQILQEKTADPKLIGGVPTPPELFPSTFLLRSGCTASKVSDVHLLTAAHCVFSQDYEDLKPQYIPGNEWPLELTPVREVPRLGRGEDIEVEILATYVHPEYLEACELSCGIGESLAQRPPNPPDLAIVKVSTDDPRWHTIPIAKLADRELADEEVIVMGYGCENGIHPTIDSPPRPTLRLKHQKTRVLIRAEIANRFDAATLDTLLENYYPTPGSRWQGRDHRPAGQASLCPGDSGGPVYVLRNSGAQVIAVNSFVMTDENDELGVSWLNAHARLDVDTSGRAWVDQIVTGRE